MYHTTNKPKTLKMRDSINRYFFSIFFDRLIEEMILNSSTESIKVYFNNIVSPIRNEFNKTYDYILYSPMLSIEVLKYKEVYEAVNTQIENIIELFDNKTIKNRKHLNPDYQMYVLFYMECCYYLLSNSFEAVEDCVDNNIVNAVSHIIGILELEINTYNATLNDKIADIKSYLLNFLCVGLSYKIRTNLVDLYKVALII